MSYRRTPGSSPTRGSMSRGTAMSMSTSGRRRPRRRLGGPARSDEERPAVAEVADRHTGQVDRDGRHRHRAGGHERLCAHAPARPQGVGEGEIEQRTEGARRAGELAGGSHLALHLALAEDHRVEAGGDPEQVPGGGPIVVDVACPGELVGADAAVVDEGLAEHGLAPRRVGDDRKQLGPIAGGQDRALADGRVAQQRAEQRPGGGLGQAGLLALRHGRCAV